MEYTYKTNMSLALSITIGNNTSFSGNKCRFCFYLCSCMIMTNFNEFNESNESYYSRNFNPINPIEFSPEQLKEKSFNMKMI